MDGPKAQPKLENKSMTLPETGLFFLVAMAGSAINSVAGGGTFITFPMLIMSGLSAIQANIVSTIALWPGSVASAFAYRRALVADRKQLTPFLIISIVGSVIGTLTLLLTPEQTFKQLVPWLLLCATLIFTFGRNLKLPASHHARPVGYGLQLAIAIYGGYFGAGIGILMLAMLQLLGLSNIHQMNAMKTILGSAINAVAVALFVLSGKVVWPVALVMVAGALMGGFFGAKLALKVSPGKVRLLVVAVGFAMTGYFFIHGV